MLYAQRLFGENMNLKNFLIPQPGDRVRIIKNSLHYFECPNDIECKECLHRPILESIKDGLITLKDETDGLMCDSFTIDCIEKV